MKLKYLLSIVSALLLFLSICPASQAYLSEVRFNVWTTNYTDHTDMNIMVIPIDTHNQNPPDIISSIQVTAPDGTVFVMDTDQNWFPYDRIFYGTYQADDFNSKTIPSGTYKVKVTSPQYNIKITETDFNNASVLAPPAITSFPDGATIDKDHVFLWTYVSGASYYRVLLWNESWDDPVFWYWDIQFRTSLTAALFPNGTFKPGHQYRIRIEARSGRQDLDKRSRSDWITFSISN
jgi:hypothetical protein